MNGSNNSGKIFFEYFLLNVLQIYTKPPNMGIILTNGIAGIREIFVLSKKLKNILGEL